MRHYRFSSLGSAGSSPTTSAGRPLMNGAGPTYAPSAQGKVAPPKPKSLLDILAFQTVDQSKPVVFPESIDEPLEKDSNGNYKKGKLYDKRVFFLIMELSKDPAFIRSLSPQTKNQWAVASAAATSLANEVTEIVQNVAKTPSAQGNGKASLVADAQSVVSTFSSGLRSVQTLKSEVEKFGGRIDSAAQGVMTSATSTVEGGAKQGLSWTQQGATNLFGKQAGDLVGTIGGAFIGEGSSEVRNLLAQGYSALKPIADDGVAFCMELMESVSGETMEVVNDVVDKVAPMAGPAGAVFAAYKQLMALLEAQWAKEAADLAQQAGEKAKLLNTMSYDMDIRAANYVVKPLAQDLGMNVEPSDFFLPRPAPGPFHKYLGNEDIGLRVPTIGKAFLAITAPSSFALEVMRFLNLWSKAEGGRSKDSTVLAFARDLRAWREESPVVQVNPWMYQQRLRFIGLCNVQDTLDGIRLFGPAEGCLTVDNPMYHAFLAYKYKIQWFTPTPFPGLVRNDTDRPYPRTYVDQSRFKLTDWLLSRPILHKQPTKANKKIKLGPDAVPSDLSKIKGGDWFCKWDWDYAPWSLKKAASQIASGYMLSNFGNWNSMREKGADDVSSQCATNGLCELSGYDRRAGRAADATIEAFGRLLSKYGFSYEFVAAGLKGLPTRWDDRDPQLAAWKSAYPTSIGQFGGTQIHWFWPERVQPIVREEDPKGRCDIPSGMRFKCGEYGFYGMPVWLKPDGSDLVTYAVTERTRSLFRLLHQLILEDSGFDSSGKQGKRGAYLMPYFVDLLLYELNAGRLTDASVTSLLAAQDEDGTWDQNKQPRTMLYTFLQNWQAKYEREVGVDRIVYGERTLANTGSLLVEAPQNVPAFLQTTEEFTPNNSQLSDIVTKYNRLRDERKTKLWSKASRVAQFAAGRRKRVDEAAEKAAMQWQGAPADQRAYAVNEAADKASREYTEKSAASLYQEANGNKAGGSGMMLALGGLALAGATWYFATKKSGAKAK